MINGRSGNVSNGLTGCTLEYLREVAVFALLVVVESSSLKPSSLILSDSRQF